MRPGAMIICPANLPKFTWQNTISMGKSMIEHQRCASDMVGFYIFFLEHTINHNNIYTYIYIYIYYIRYIYIYYNIYFNSQHIFAGIQPRTGLKFSTGRAKHVFSSWKLQFLDSTLNLCIVNLKKSCPDHFWISRQHFPVIFTSLEWLGSP